MPDFSDYIVYVNESGDPILTGVDVELPMFALAFRIFEISRYHGTVVPAMNRLKFDYWGHDCAILHERDIRKRRHDFEWLMAGRQRREQFLAELHDQISDAPFRIIASVIDKIALKKQYADPWSPYNIALLFCLERPHGFLLKNGQKGRVVNVIFECRGRKEDRALELEFRRIISGERRWGYRQVSFDQITFEPRFTPKSVNIIGVQIADLVARPLALHTFRPDQQNRTYGVLAEKLYARKASPERRSAN